ncbi:MAG: RlmE family RNA methyltransferase [Spirochaetes bacterium]|jgi:23S rRNA (uridine2552-2'-O)-methyltransferase|nr:RlmE family RNA methyltransferase [Spirochaetota bacterium]
MPRRDKPDHYAQRAKKDGYKARSVYKLQEIDDKLHVLSGARRVLDVGAAPGSWTQYALERMSRGGTVVAVDLKPVELPPSDSLRTIEGDVTDEEVRSELRELGPFDLILSDAAPSTSGNRTLDSARSAELVEIVLGLADELLAPGGHMVAKLFQGGDEKSLLEAARARFRSARIQRPKASRRDSFEVFIVGVDHRPATPSAPAEGEGPP